MPTRPLIRVPLKEELVELTGDFQKALMLQQMIYWSERVRDFDAFIREEAERAELYGLETPNVKPRNGWIYKTAKDLSEESLLRVSEQTIRRDLKVLIDNGWIEERRNPENKMDRTMQYRVNILKIALDLNALGYHLDGYKVNFSDLVSEVRNQQAATSETVLPSSILDNATDVLDDASLTVENLVKTEHASSKMEPATTQGGGALPETTYSEITYPEGSLLTPIILNRASAREMSPPPQRPQRKPGIPYAEIASFFDQTFRRPSPTTISDDLIRLINDRWTEVGGLSGIFTLATLGMYKLSPTFAGSLTELLQPDTFERAVKAVSTASER